MNGEGKVKRTRRRFTPCAGNGLRRFFSRCGDRLGQRETWETFGNSLRCVFFTSQRPLAVYLRQDRSTAVGPRAGLASVYIATAGSAIMCLTFDDVPLGNFSICTEKMGLITHRGSDLSYSRHFLNLLYVFFIIKNKSKPCTYCSDQ